MAFLAQFRPVTSLTSLRIPLNVFLAALYLLSVCQVSRAGGPVGGLLAPQAITAPSGAETTANRVRVAEGEYKVLTEDGIGPFLPAVYGFSESWTLWRLADGTFEVDGTRSYRSPSYESHSVHFLTRLSSDFRLVQLTEYRKLRWRHDSGPITCDFLPGKITCTSNAKDAAQNVNLDLPMKEPFGFIWPISVFSLGSVTRSAVHDPRKLTPVELVRVEEVSRADPALATILSGDMKYIGQEELLLAGRKWRADKFELKVPLHAAFSIWTSPEGLLLGFAPGNDIKMLSESGMQLVSFRQWQEF
jgi:hypothetical protein